MLSFDFAFSFSPRLNECSSIRWNSISTDKKTKREHATHESARPSQSVCKRKTYAHMFYKVLCLCIERRLHRLGVITLIHANDRRSLLPFFMCHMRNRIALSIGYCVKRYTRGVREVAARFTQT